MLRASASSLRIAFVCPVACKYLNNRNWMGQSLLTRRDVVLEVEDSLIGLVTLTFDFLTSK